MRMGASMDDINESSQELGYDWEENEWLAE